MIYISFNKKVNSPIKYKKNISSIVTDAKMLLETILFIILGGAYSSCTRPTDYHWLVDNTPSNTSIQLFSGNSGTIERVYLDFSHSNCKRPYGGQYFLHCGERTFNLPCEHETYTQVGLGQDSPVWYYYSHMVFDNQRIVLDDEVKTYTEQCQTQPLIPIGRENYLCSLDNIETHWEYGGDKRQSNNTVMMFTSNTHARIPVDIYNAFQVAIQKGEEHYNEIYIILKLNNILWKCGNECLYTTTLFGGFELWALPDTRNNVVELSERFLHYKTLNYDARSRTIQFDDNKITVKHKHKLAVQLLLLPKIIYGFWVFTRRKEEHNDPNQQELLYEIFDIIILAMITLEELLMHSHREQQYAFVLGMVGFICAVKAIEFGLHNKDADDNFEASIVIGNVIPIFILQTMLQELDSYECVVIALSIQVILIFNDLLEVVIFFKNDKKHEYLIRLVFLTLFIIPSIVVNYMEWLSVFFDEIVSLLLHNKTVLVIFFYSVLLLFLIEVWKRKPLFQKVKFI